MSIEGRAPSWAIRMTVNRRFWLGPPPTASPNIGADHALQFGQRDVAAHHHRVVEGAQVEAGAQRRLGLAPQPDDLAVAHLVAAGLARPGAVAVDLALNLLAGRAVGGHEPLDGLVSG